ncbi:MAG: hypothetical protein QXS91_02135 [Candidatus Anstonellales archaeon]
MEILNNVLDNEALLGNLKLSINDGLLYLGKGSKFFIIAPSRLGLREITIDARILKINEKQAYVFDKTNKAFVISPKEEHGELKIDIKELTLPFILSNHFRGCSYNTNFLIIDIKNGSYIMLVGNNIISSKISISDKAMPFMVNDVGVIIDKKDMHVIKNGIRNVLVLAKALNTSSLMIDYEKRRGETTIFISDGTYDVKMVISDNGNIKYGERANIFFESKKE